MIIEEEKASIRFIKSIQAFFKSPTGMFFTRLAFFSILAYFAYDPTNIESNELVEVKITTEGKWKSGGRRSAFRIKFKAKEYPCRFGIYVGGTYGRWSEVTNALEENNINTIKIHSSYFSDLNTEDEIIPVYYLKNSLDGVIFDEFDFNAGEQSSSNRILAFYIALFLLSLLALKKKKSRR